MRRDAAREAPKAPRVIMEAAFGSLRRGEIGMGLKTAPPVLVSSVQDSDPVLQARET